jgi:hypothetical protein
MFMWAPCAQLYLLAETRKPPTPTPLIRALLVSQDRRHLFVTPVCMAVLFSGQ